MENYKHMLSLNIKKQIQHNYKRMKHGKIKGILLYLTICVVAACIISLFQGNPFPHKESFTGLSIDSYGSFLFPGNPFSYKGAGLSRSVWNDGWMYTGLVTYPYLLVFFCVAACVLSIIVVCVPLIRDVNKYNQVLLRKCDVKSYLEIMEYGVTYGKTLTFRGFQGSVFSVMQENFVLALIANKKLEECRRFLEEEWTGKRNSRTYKRLVMNLNLVEAYEDFDSARFNELFQKAGRRLKKEKLLVAEKMFLEQKYDQTIALLKAYKASTRYNEVFRHYLMGMCYDKMDNQKMAEDCMRYVSEHGNTMPCRERAQEWISQEL